METEIPNEILTQQSSILVDNSIESRKLILFSPQTTADLNRTTEKIVIDIAACDSYYNPSQSYIKIKGRLVGADNAAYGANTQIALINNAPMYLFQNIDYKLGGETMETIRNPGQTTSMIGYMIYPDDFNSSAGLNQCWRKDTNVGAISAEYTASPAVAADAAIAAGRFTPQRNANYNDGFAIRRKLLMDSDAPGEFSFIVPFSHIFGFAEYNKVLYNLRHTLTFTRGSNDLPIHRANGVAAGKIVLTDIRWVIPQIIPSIEMRATLLKTVRDRTNIPIHFSSRNDEVTEVTPNARSFVWKINTSAGVEKPRWVFVGFQTSKTNTQEQNPAVFDHINMISHSLKMGSEKYPSEATLQV